MFEFHRVGWINCDDKEISGWLCLITTDEQLHAYFLYRAHFTAQAWMDIKNSPEYKEGHCRTNLANAMKTILSIKIEKEGKKQISMIEAVSHMEEVLTRTTINIFEKEGQVYVNAAGGCRHTNLRNDHKGADEKIFEIRKREDFIFPTDGQEEVKITKWAGGPHFYLSVNGRNIEVNGVPKWNTVEGAEEAKEEYLRRN